MWPVFAHALSKAAFGQYWEEFQAMLDDGAMADEDTQQTMIKEETTNNDEKTDESQEITTDAASENNKNKEKKEKLKELSNLNQQMKAENVMDFAALAAVEKEMTIANKSEQRQQQQSPLENQMSDNNMNDMEYAYPNIELLMNLLKLSQETIGESQVHQTHQKLDQLQHKTGKLICDTRDTHT